MVLFLYAALLAVPVTLNAMAIRDDYKRYVDAAFASGMLCAIWAFTNILAQFYEFPASKQWHPLIDLIGLTVCVAAYMTMKSAWKLILAMLFLAQLVCHAVFWLAWWGYVDSSPQLGRQYIFLLNLLWFGQLICVGAPGGMHAAHRALLHLRTARGLPRMARD